MEMENVYFSTVHRKIGSTSYIINILTPAL